MGLLGDLTTTTLVNPHLGKPLPIARFIVVAVPILAVTAFAMLRNRGRGRR